MKKRTLSLLCVLALMLAMLPQMAWALPSEHTYIDATGISQPITDSSEYISDSTTTLSGGFYVAINGLNLDKTLDVTGDCSLVLCKGTIGIKELALSNDATLTIYTEQDGDNIGTLTGYGAAAPGGFANITGSGTVKAIGGHINIKLNSSTIKLADKQGNTYQTHSSTPSSYLAINEDGVKLDTNTPGIYWLNVSANGSVMLDYDAHADNNATVTAKLTGDGSSSFEVVIDSFNCPQLYINEAGGKVKQTIVSSTTDEFTTVFAAPASGTSGATFSYINDGDLSKNIGWSMHTSGSSMTISGARDIPVLLSVPDAYNTSTPVNLLMINATYGNVTVTQGAPKGQTGTGTPAKITFASQGTSAYNFTDLAAENWDTATSLFPNASNTEFSLDLDTSKVTLTKGTAQFGVQPGATYTTVNGNTIVNSSESENLHVFSTVGKYDKITGEAHNLGTYDYPNYVAGANKFTVNGTTYTVDPRGKGDNLTVLVDSDKKQYITYGMFELASGATFKTYEGSIPVVNTGSSSVYCYPYDASVTVYMPDGSSTKINDCNFVANDSTCCDGWLEVYYSETWGPGYYTLYNGKLTLAKGDTINVQGGILITNNGTPTLDLEAHGDGYNTNDTYAEITLPKGSSVDVNGAKISNPDQNVIINNRSGSYATYGNEARINLNTGETITINDIKYTGTTDSFLIIDYNGAVIPYGAPTQERQSDTTNTYGIIGNVYLNGDNGKIALENARVELVQPGLAPTIPVVHTSESGNFMITGVPAGRYNLRITYYDNMYPTRGEILMLDINSDTTDEYKCYDCGDIVLDEVLRFRLQDSTMGFGVVLDDSDATEAKLFNGLSKSDFHYLNPDLSIYSAYSIDKKITAQTGSKNLMVFQISNGLSLHMKNEQSQKKYQTICGNFGDVNLIYRVQADTSKLSNLQVYRLPYEIAENTYASATLSELKAVDSYDELTNNTYYVADDEVAICVNGSDTMINNYYNSDIVLAYGSSGGSGGNGHKKNDTTTKNEDKTEDKTEDKQDDTTGSGFTDVPDNAWFTEAINYAVANGLMTGDSATKFLPNANTTRDQFVTVLWRMAGSPNTDAKLTFTDTLPNTWYSDAIRWAAAKQIVTGYEDGSFGVNKHITREELITILYRYAGAQGIDTTQGGMAAREFADWEQTSGYARPAMTWAVNVGLIKGNADNTLNPRGTATRAEMAQIFTNFAKFIADNK